MQERPAIFKEAIVGRPRPFRVQSCLWFDQVLLVYDDDTAVREPQKRSAFEKTLKGIDYSEVHVWEFDVEGDGTIASIGHIENSTAAEHSFHCPSGVRVISERRSKRPPSTQRGRKATKSPFQRPEDLPYDIEETVLVRESEDHHSSRTRRPNKLGNCLRIIFQVADDR